MTLRSYSGAAPEEIFNEAAKILARDKAKLSGLNYPVYYGQTISPMSTLTQRARELNDRFNSKPAPYTRKIEGVLNRSNQGINPGALTGQLNNLRGQQQNFHDTGLLGTLNKQFREAYNPRADRFREKGTKDSQGVLNEASGQLQDIGRSAGILEQSSNQSLAERLRLLQSQKEARRKGLVGTLEQFGAQKHGYNNLANSIARNSFEQEASEPARRLEMLQQTLGPLSANMQEGTHPDIQSQAGKEAVAALRAYESAPSYKGKLIADLPPEILASYNTLEAVDPKFRDSQYSQRKNLIHNLMANSSIGDRAMEAVPEKMRPQVGNLETDARKRFKKDLALINNQFIQANQYGSPQHIKSAEKRAREVSKATLEQRNKMLQDTMKSELSAGHQQQQANLRQAGLYGDHAQKEFEDMLNIIRNMNNLGATKFANEQAENEDLYKNFQNEASWEWPHLKNRIAGEARQGALGDVFRGLANRSISLDNLSALNTKYSESQKEARTARDQLQTSNSIMADLQRQLAAVKQAADKKRADEEGAELARQRLADQEANKRHKQAYDEHWRIRHLRDNTAPNKLDEFNKQYVQSSPFNFWTRR